MGKIQPFGPWKGWDNYKEELRIHKWRMDNEPGYGNAFRAQEARTLGWNIFGNVLGWFIGLPFLMGLIVVIAFLAHLCNNGCSGWGDGSY